MRNKLTSLWYTDGIGSFRAQAEGSAIDLGFTPGVLVQSTAGRDLGHCYAITAAVDRRRVLVADGLLRPASRPKVKNIKHLMIMPQQSRSLAERMSSGQRVRDEDLQTTLQALQTGPVVETVEHGQP